MEKLSDQSEKVFEMVSNSFCEIIRGRQEFYKTLLTLNTTTLLILIAFSDKIIRPPVWTKLLLIPFILFVLSLIFSLLTMKQFADYHACLIDFQTKVIAKVAFEDKSTGDLLSTKKQLNEIGKKAARYQNPALYTYLFGMLSLVIFAALSLFLAK